MKIAPIKNKKFGGVVTNVKLKNISDVECSGIKEAFLNLGFLLFPRQFLTDEENIHFGECFGTLEFGAQSIANQKKMRTANTVKYMGIIFNVCALILVTNIGIQIQPTGQ